MHSSSEFALPIKGLGNGVHHFNFDISKAFFADYEQEIIQSEASFQVQLELDKRSDMVILNFDINGTLATNCDRCSANIQMPIAGEQRTIVKFKESIIDTVSEEYIFVSPNEPVLDIKDFIYEAIMLSMPMVYKYDCEEEDPVPCDIDVLEKLEQLEKETDEPNIWADLLKIKDKLN